MKFEIRTIFVATFAICLSVVAYLRMDGVFGVGVSTMLALVIGVALFAMIEQFWKEKYFSALASAFFVGAVGAILCFPSLVAPEAVRIDQRMTALRKSVRRVLGGSEAYSSLDARSIYSYHFGWHVLIEGQLASQADLNQLCNELAKPLHDLQVRIPVDAGIGQGNKPIELDTSKVIINNESQ